MDKLDYEMCPNSFIFRFLINGSPYGDFIATHGLRQVDHLSQYLFILCLDVLTILMKQGEGRIKGIRVSNGGPSISHLLFVVDSLFFLKADYANSLQLMKIFEEYGAASGHLINLEKSAITFGNCVYEHTRDGIMQTLKIPNVEGGGKYLGLTEKIGRNEKEMLPYIQEKKKINSWQTRFLTTADKETH